MAVAVAVISLTEYSAMPEATVTQNLLQLHVEPAKDHGEENLWNVVVKCLTVLLLIYDVPVSNLGPRPLLL